MKTFFLVLFFIVGFTSISQTQTGKASLYAEKFDGRPTASGEIYKHNLATAAHRKLPFGTKVKVTNLENNKVAIVKINDRGPFIRGRIIDLSRSVANSLGIFNTGVSDVRIEVLDENAQASAKTVEYKSSSVKNKKNQQVKKSVTETNNANSEGNEFYELTVDEVKPNFYGLQIASFTESANLIRLANRLKTSYNSKVIVQVKTINQTKMYTVIIGQFSNRKAAENFKLKHLDKYPGSFIVDMTKKD